VVLGATALGAVIGACSGAAVVHWRVRVRLTVGDAIELEFRKRPTGDVPHEVLPRVIRVLFPEHPHGQAHAA
jgi:hypothetical protein